MMLHVQRGAESRQHRDKGSAQANIFVHSGELSVRRLSPRLQTCNTAHANYKQTEPQSDSGSITLLFSKMRMF
jgi:hypothetical protein